MTTISGINPSDDDKKIPLNPRKAEVKNEPLPLIEASQSVDVSKDFNVPGFSLESSQIDARDVYYKRFKELHKFQSCILNT